MPTTYNADLVSKKEEARVINEANVALAKLESEIIEDGEFVAGNFFSIADLHIIFCIIICHTLVPEV